jgi:hypothetical protein
MIELEAYSSQTISARGPDRDLVVGSEVEDPVVGVGVLYQSRQGPDDVTDAQEAAGLGAVPIDGDGLNAQTLGPRSEGWVVPQVPVSRGPKVLKSRTMTMRRATLLPVRVGQDLSDGFASELAQRLVSGDRRIGRRPRAAGQSNSCHRSHCLR